ncbi:hypothetical protein QEN19_001205 [Hanseniaspora menglaensis]
MSASENPDSHFKYNVIISDPQRKRKEETGETFISYSISIRTDNPKYYSHSDLVASDDLFSIDNTIVTRKRYSDFLILNQFLKIDFPLINIPKLPSKNNYSIKKIYNSKTSNNTHYNDNVDATGSKENIITSKNSNAELDDDFLLKRLYSLELYLNILVNHYCLQEYALLITFMTNDEEWNILKNTIQFTKENIHNGNNTEEEISDYLMNVFKKPNKEFKEIKEIKMKLERLVYNLNKILKDSMKLNKIQELIIKDFSNLQKFKYDIIAQDKQNLKNFDKSNAEKEFSEFQNNIKSTKILLTNFHKFEKYENLNNLQNTINYLKQLFDLIKLLDYKQLDLESLQDILNKMQIEKKKYENSNPEKFKKNEIKLRKLETELQDCNEQVVTIFQIILKESENIEMIKNLQLKKIFKELALKKVEFYSGMSKVWGS